MRLLALVIVAAMAGTTLADEAGDVADRALDMHRDDKHRAEVRIVWPALADEQAPRDVDVLLITGYISSTCLRFHRADGGPVLCDRIGLSRTWFHDPDGEAFETRRIEVAPERFGLAWEAARRLLAARAELVNPPPGPEVIIDEDGDGEFETFIFRGPQLSHSTGSHQSWEWLRIRAGEASLAEACVRGHSSENGILDFDELRIRAVRQVFLDLAADGIDAGRPFPAAEWASGLQADLARLPPADGARNIDDVTRIFCEAAIRILGETGNDETATVIGAFRTRLLAREPQGALAEGLRREADRARQRIDLRQHWDSATATRLIHANDGSRHADNDQEHWIRRTFHERDPSGYLSLLRSDLRSDDLRKVVPSIPAIATLRPDGWIDDLGPLLDHAHDEVACDAAFAMLGIRREASHAAADRVAAVTAAGAAALRDDRLADAWRTIERLAADPRVEIPPAARYRFHRADAVALLTSEACPQPWHWDRERVLRRLDDPAERDPRILAQLLTRAGITVLDRPVHRPPPERQESLVGIWRRGLGEPLTAGTATAVAQLAACGDVDSLPTIRRIIDTLEDGCHRAPFDPPGGPTRFPWIGFDEVVKLREYVADML